MKGKTADPKFPAEKVNPKTVPSFSGYIFESEVTRGVPNRPDPRPKIIQANIKKLKLGENEKRRTLNELGLHDLPIVAIAKGKYRNSGNETFFHNGKEFKFTKNDPTLFFLQRIRDESHRFAISAHRAKRKKGISKSLLDQIDGIGSIRKRALLNHFGSARAVESASLDEIKSVDGVEEKVAKKIYNFFHE